MVGFRQSAEALNADDLTLMTLVLRRNDSAGCHLTCNKNAAKIMRIMINMTI
jgi:hypothetical protein